MASSYFYISVLLLLSTSFAHSFSPHVLCHAGDSTALLQFNQSFVIDKLASSFAHPKVLSWNLQTDCCSWEGVDCDENDGHVIGLDLTSSCLFGSINSSSSLFRLNHLQRLSLADNHFNYSHIPPEFGNLSPTLTHLNLSASHFAGQIPSEISTLSKLSVLDLGLNVDSSLTSLLQLKKSTFTSLVQNLTSLETLVLSYVDISSSTVPHALSNLSSLSKLYLRSCNLAGEFPPSVFMLPHLQFLSIRYNEITGHLPLFNSSSLEIFKVGQTSLSGELPPYSVQNLPSLTDFDIGYSSFSGPIPSSFGNLTNLTYLDLSLNNLEGEFPSSVFMLPRLQFLSIWYNFQITGHLPLFNSSSLEVLKVGVTNLSGELPPYSIQNLPSLTEFDIGYSNFTGPIPSSFGNLTNLTYLDLSLNNLEGEFPSSVFMLPRLQFLSIWYNFQITGHLPLFNSSSLEVLKVGVTNLSGELPPYSIQNLPSLTEFDIGYSNFTGPIPSSFGNLTNLTYLDLSFNNLEGEFPSSVFLLPRLQDLNIRNNFQITGHFPQFNSSSLESLRLHHTNLSGELPHDSIQNLPSLVLFDFASCGFSGPIPSSFGNLTNLTTLDFSFNNFTVGDLSWFTHLTNLRWLSFINVNFSGEIPYSLSRVDKLEFLYMSSCQLTGRIPFWIGNLTRLTVLSLGGNQLEGPVPQSISQLVNLSMFRIRKNNLSGTLEVDMFRGMKSLTFLDIGYNMFNGHVPVPPPSIVLYVAGNNSLTGEISPFFCNLDSLVILDLSHNDLSGQLPPCLANLTRLSVLNLNNNTFSGTIPPMCTNSSSKLALLDFSANQLQGTLPRSLASCEMLRKLDVGDNHIEDTFPFWMGRLHVLQLLSLRSNRFHGSIQRLASISNTKFLNLSIMDISNNGFSGDLPSALFRNWKRVEKTTSLVQFAGMEIDDIFIDPSNYDKADIEKFSMELANKGNELQYAKIPNGFAGVDFSSNNFSGVIPKYIGNLNGLYMLNLSHNHLTGQIPSSFANLIVLESLDLSHNKLSGQIPQEMAQLTSLAVLDVSHNNLTGQVPRGKQFDTFTDSSFDGNVGLCGYYLITRKCKDPAPPPPMHVCSEDCEGAESSFLDKSHWIVAAIGCAGGLVVGFVMGNELMARKQEWFVKVFGGKMQPQRRNRRNRRN